MSATVPYTRIETAVDGSSRFDDGEIELSARIVATGVPAMLVGALPSAAGVVFVRSDGFDSAPHPAPARQWVIMIRGVIEVTTTDGEARQFGPGDLLLAADTEGEGHRTLVGHAAVRGPLHPRRVDPRRVRPRRSRLESDRLMTALAYRLDPLRGLDGLTVDAQPRPTPGPGQVLVRVRAASLNRRDLMLMDGSYPLPATPGVVPLSDGVGEVVAVGPGAKRAAVGDRVTGTYFQRWVAGPQRLVDVREQYGANHNGWLAGHVLLEDDSVVAAPEHLTDAEAASLTCAGVVAWAAVTKPVPPTPGETVLTVGTGTVALFAVQFAHLHGARVVSVTSSADKAKRLLALGADEAIDRGRTPDWAAAVRELTDGAGADHVVDAVGMPTLPRSVAAAAFNARVTVIGAFPATEPVMDPFFGTFVSIRRIAVGSRTDFEAMNAALAAHRLRPVIDWEFPFDQAVEGYRHFRDGNPFGKVVIRV